MRILVAPLNWGLGHATRCIPIIKELEASGFEVIIASDGEALELLKREFPHIIHLELPSYKIRYTRKGGLLKWKLFLESFRIQKVIKEERSRTEKIVKQFNIEGIISDNRFGVRSSSLDKNIFITHQINVLSGIFSFLSSFINRQYLKKFDQCWIPDHEGSRNLSGKLGHPKNLPENCKYIGPISRLQKTLCKIKFDYLILLSGPEPQRSLLETILLEAFENTNFKVKMIRGAFNEPSIQSVNSKIHVTDHLLGNELEKVICKSKYVISRPGYTTLMDLSKLGKKAFFIPTPGQEEQNYLTSRLEQKGISPYCKQHEFHISQLERIDHYSGLGDIGAHHCIRDFFQFFKSK